MWSPTPSIVVVSILIEPVGIETCKDFLDEVFIDILIEPVGIETCYCKSCDKIRHIILIEPVGIETSPIQE